MQCKTNNLKLCGFVKSWEKERKLAAVGGEEVGEEPNHTTARKPSPL